MNDAIMAVFLRYSIGGELQNRYGAFSGGGGVVHFDKHAGEQVAFSREGKSAPANGAAIFPGLLGNARVDYYPSGGKY